jgi:hypothetical protein
MAPVIIPLIKPVAMVMSAKKDFGGIKMPTSTAFGFKVNSCVDAEIGGVSHVKGTTRTGIEHQRDRQKNSTQPWDD